MSPWYVPSLYPIVSLSFALAGLVLWRDRRHWPIAAFCASLGAWATSILLAASPSTQAWGDRTMMVGFFIPATFLHVAGRELSWGRRSVGAVYGLGLAMTLMGLFVPEIFLSGGGTEPGRLFWPMLAATVVVGIVPLWLLWRIEPGPAARERRRYLWLAGAAMAVGGATNVGLMLAGAFYPLGLYLLLCAVALTTYVAQAERLPSFSRFVERSQRYALLAALLSAVWMALLLSILQVGVLAVGAGWTWEAALLLFVLALAAQPLLTEARIGLTGVMFPGGGDGDGLTRALAQSEARAEHARRLAEIGTMASAVAHEVRNPLGVITACMTVLERQGADAQVLAEIREQVARAVRFSDELLEYGRPSPPRLRRLSLASAAEMAISEVTRALGRPRQGLTVEGDADVDGDLVQVARLLSVLVENALLSGSQTVRISILPGVAVSVEDDGSGVPEAIVDRLFSPFVSGRGREGPRPGTGLGLAIALGIANRHGGTLSYDGRGALGGARFVLRLPMVREPA